MLEFLIMFGLLIWVPMESFNIGLVKQFPREFVAKVSATSLVHAPTTITIGSRGSPLAMAQALETKRLLEQHFPFLASSGSITIKKIMTTGDSVLNQALSAIGGKGLFTKELDVALLDKTVDICVHSMKDVPTQLPPATVLPCILEREATHDVFISNKYQSLSSLPDGAVIGSASLRRQAQLQAMNPTWKVVNFRGNVQTRLKKMDNGDVDGTMLALAGLRRLCLWDVIARSETLAWDRMLPAVSQGAIGIQCRADDAPMLEMLAHLNHPDSRLAVECERAFLAGLEGDCRTPIAGQATVVWQEASSPKSSNNNIRMCRIEFIGLISRPDGSDIERVRLSSEWFARPLDESDHRYAAVGIDVAIQLGAEAAALLRRQLGEAKFADFKRASAAAVASSANTGTDSSTYNHPKRTGYIQFLVEERNNIKAEILSGQQQQQQLTQLNEVGNKRQLNNAVLLRAGEHWAAMSTERKAAYSARGAAGAATSASSSSSSSSSARAARRSRRGGGSDSSGDDDDDEYKIFRHKKRLNSFMLFLRGSRDAIKNRLVAEAHEVSPQQLSRAVSAEAGRLWRALSTEERDRYAEQAAAQPLEERRAGPHVTATGAARPNAFMHFLSENRASLKQQVMAEKPFISPKELNCAVASLAGEWWRGLNATARDAAGRRAVLSTAQRGAWRRYTTQEVAGHRTVDDCWLTVDGRVYDVTDFVEGHPGGYAILNHAGADSSVGFHGEQHPAAATEVLQSYFIGELAQ